MARYKCAVLTWPWQRSATRTTTASSRIRSSSGPAASGPSRRASSVSSRTTSVIASTAEPFVGGGAMFFYLQPHRAILSDSLRDLIETYRVVQRHVDALISRLERLRETHSTEQFYAIRAAFNEERSARASSARRGSSTSTRPASTASSAPTATAGSTCRWVASRTRASSTRPRCASPSAALCDAELVHDTLRSPRRPRRAGRRHLLRSALRPARETSSFCAYADGAFTLRDQARLAEMFRELDDRGCLLRASRTATRPTCAGSTRATTSRRSSRRAPSARRPRRAAK